MNIFSDKTLRRLFQFYSIPIFFLLSLLLLSMLLFLVTYQKTSERNQSLFELRTNIASNAIEKRLNDYIQILNGAKGFFSASDSVSQAAWKEYYSYLNIEKNYPGLLGMGFASMLKKQQIPSLEKRMQQAGFPEFRVWPEGNRELYSSILYLEPFDEKNQRALGYDMLTEPTRLEAMLRARDMGKPAMSGVVTLVQEGSSNIQKGFLIYLPVYKSDTEPTNITDRKKLLLGFAYSPFRVNDLINGTLQNRFPDLDIEIYDAPKPSRDKLLYDSDSVSVFQADYEFNAFSSQQLVNISGRHWLVAVNARPNFGHDRAFPFWLLAGGIIISALVFILMLSIAKERETTYLKQLITDNATASIFILDKHGYCTFMNPTAEYLTGYQMSDLEGQSFHQLLHFKHPDGSLFHEDDCAISQALKVKGSLTLHEDFIIHRSGHFLPVSINAQPVYGGAFGGGYLLELQDITHQVRSKEDLKRQNRKLEIINSIGLNLSAELEINKLLNMVTEAATHLSGADFGAFFYNEGTPSSPNMQLYALVVADHANQEKVDSNQLTELVSPFFASKEIIRSTDITLDKRFSTNSPKTAKEKMPLCSYLAVPIILHSKNIAGNLLLGHGKAGMFGEDAEDQVRGIAAQAAIAIENSQLFEDISKKNEELIRTNTDLDNFVYSASHDLKAPVLNIEGLISALNAALTQGKTERVQPIINMMHNSVKKFKETIQALTEVSRTNKNLDDTAELIRVDDILEGVLQNLDELIRKEGVIIDKSIECPKIQFSPAYMRSILQNLISNAIKYRHKERQPHIKVCCSTRHGQMQLSVKDNGLGLPENQRNKIFGLFKRYHGHIEGTGVGLYLVKRILDNNGGTITVDSEEGKGSTFTITLPLKAASLFHTSTSSANQDY